MTCGRVVIINRGRVVAEDTPDALTRRLRGSGGVRLEIRGDAAVAREALRSVNGVVSVEERSAHPGAAAFDVVSEAGKDVRAELAAAIVGRGLGLLALEQAAMSLEEIFLELTTSDAAEGAPAPAATPEVTA